MAFRTEISLEELLAEPMVKLLMRRDGVSISDARALYASVRSELKEGAKPARWSVAKSPCIAPWAACSPDRISPCM